MMGHQLKGTLYYLYANVRFPLTVFWVIISSILALSIISSYLMSEGTISFQLSLSVYIFCSIIGTWTVKSAIPYALKLGSTRKNLYVSLGIYFLGFAIVNSLLANVLNGLVSTIFGIESLGGMGEITKANGTETFTFFHIAQFIEGNSWFTYIMIDIVICFFLLIVAYIIGLFFYKYGLIGGFGLLGLAMFTLIFTTAKGWLSEFLITIFSDFSIVFFYQLFVVALIIYMVTFILIRRITI